MPKTKRRKKPFSKTQETRNSFGSGFALQDGANDTLKGATGNCGEWLHSPTQENKVYLYCGSLTNPQGSTWNLLFQEIMTVTSQRGFISLIHCNLVHKFTPMLQAMEISGAKAAESKECEKLEKLLAWQMDKVKSKKIVILDAPKDKKKVHFATLMDSCHLKNAELVPKHQKYTRRVVFRGDTKMDRSIPRISTAQFSQNFWNP